MTWKLVGRLGGPQPNIKSGDQLRFSANESGTPFRTDRSVRVRRVNEHGWEMEGPVPLSVCHDDYVFVWHDEDEKRDHRRENRCRHGVGMDGLCERCYPMFFVDTPTKPPGLESGVALREWSEALKAQVASVYGVSRVAETVDIPPLHAPLQHLWTKAAAPNITPWTGSLAGQLASLQERNAELEDEAATLRARVAELEKQPSLWRCPRVTATKEQLEASYSLADVKGDPYEHGQSSAVAKAPGIASRKREIIVYCQGDED